tara:strand:+ start:680 stop:1231 length:552 start_codon:yes stop_codon:yes gene_type:complete
MRSVWDFNETKNYTSVNNYKVIISPLAESAAVLLEILDTLVRELQYKIKVTKVNMYDRYLDLLSKTPHILQEMQLHKDQGSIIFNGLNKPKGVHSTRDIPIGNDKRLRATYRKVFLTLKHRNGRLKNVNEMKSLLAHELTHTALNHVTWKDDNHSKLFKEYNKIILSIINSILSVSSIRRQPV